MKAFRSLTGLFLAAAVLVVGSLGCKKDAASLGAEGSKAFQSAPADVKQKWDQAVAALNSKDYAKAIITLQDLKSVPTITPEQLKAVEQTATAASDQMYEAANKGDAGAQKAINDLRDSLKR
jgi:hypothetical protein